MEAPLRFKPTDVSFKAWLLRWAIGPAAILDGIVGVITLGTVLVGCSLAVSRILARHRMSIRS